QTNLLSVRISVANPRGLARIGAFATTDIVLRSDPAAVVVPKQAIVTRDEKQVVVTVSADAVAHLKPVTLGAEQGDVVEVTSGVRPGDKVIRIGQHEIADGAKVK